MKENPPRLQVLVGEHRRLSAAAILLSGVLFLLGMTIEYITLSQYIAGNSVDALFQIRDAIRLVAVWEADSWTPLTWIYGYFLVIGLAGIHSYYNNGVLPSILLGLGLPLGVALVTIFGVDEYVGLSLQRAVYVVLPIGVVGGAVGYTLGHILRQAFSKPTWSPTDEA